MPPLGADIYSAHDPVSLLNSSVSSFRSTVTVHHNQKHSVRFSDEVEVKEALHVNDFTDEEHEAYWHTDNEYNLIIDMIEITVQLMEMNQDEDCDNNVCYRGLETRTAAGNEYYETIYQETVLSVLCEQDEQRQRGVADDERIRYLCCDQTQIGREYALLRAQNDFSAAKEYLLST